MGRTAIPREEERNQLLRRVDWRFLLPNPKPDKSICFADEELTRAVELVSDHLVDKHDAPVGECELAVAVDPDPKTLATVWSALHDGGSCYVECYSRFAGSPEYVRRRLEAVGFVNVTCYATWPMFGRPRAQRHLPAAWLPLHTPAALRYAAAHFLPGRRAIHRVIRTIAEQEWFLCRAARRVRPVRAIACKPGSPPAGASESLLELVRSQPAIRDRDVGRETMSWALLTGGQRSISKVVALGFADGATDPALVVKLPRIPESGSGLAREAAVLETLHGRHPGGLPGAPRVVFRREIAGVPALGETTLSGQPIIALLDRNNYRDLALAASDWLTNLVDNSKSVAQTTWWNRLVEPTLTEFSNQFGSVLDAGMIDKARNCLAVLGPLPSAVEHRDFSPWNVLITPVSEVVVLDWESAELDGLPALDLIYFLAYLTHFVGRARPRWLLDSYRTMLDPATRTGRVVAECVERYCRAADLDPGVIQPLRLLVWMVHARSEYQRIASDIAGEPREQDLRRSLFVELWKEELRHNAGSH